MRTNFNALKFNNIRPDMLAYVFCLLYGFSSLFFISSAGDGTWFLYASQIMEGKRLYTDLHLNQQPLFPILSILAIKFGNGSILWDRLFYLFVPFLYVHVIFNLVRIYVVNYLARSVVIIFLYFNSITFVAFRFDDYNSFVFLLIFTSFYLFAKMVFINDAGKIDKYIAMQMIVLSLLALTKIADGFFLGGAFVIGFILFYGQVLRLTRFLIFGLLFYIALLSLFLYCFLDETIISWLNNTIIDAAGAKGGGSILLYPAIMVGQCIEFIKSGNYSLFYMTTLVFSVLVLNQSAKAIHLRTLFIIISAFLFGVTLYEIFHQHILTIVIPFVLLGILFFIYYILISLILLNKKPILFHTDLLVFFVFPFFTFLSGSLSSGGYFRDHFMPAAMAIFVIFIYINRCESKYSYLYKHLVAMLVFALAVNAIYLKFTRPYHWHSYYSSPFVTGYHIELSSSGNLNLIQNELSQLVRPVCEQVKNEELLSIPYSYANYYCKIPLWHGNVQSFFDTTSHAKVYEIIDTLKKSPPKYIFYQRQISNLTAHENIFNRGKQLPQRELDNLLMTKLKNNEWNVVYKSTLYPPSEWLLIKTNAP